MKNLVGDIGGTKTILAVMDSDQNQNKLLYEKRYISKDFDNLKDLINDYLEDIPFSIKNVCLAVAGPIDRKKAKITNLPWLIDAYKITNNFKFDSFQLINDLEAIALAIPILTPNDLITLYKGTEVKGGAIAVIAPGTGLGEAYLTFDDGQYFAHASEGAHASFSPINSEQIQLLEYFQKQGYEHVSFERVCSGAVGIPNLYKFVKDKYNFDESWDFKNRIKETDDITPIIIETAQKYPTNCASCKKVLDIFCDILAVESGNLALKTLSMGGIYLAGGISAKIIDQLKSPKFVSTLQNKGRFSELLRQIPIKVIVNPNAGLIGAAQYLLNYN